MMKKSELFYLKKWNCYKITRNFIFCRLDEGRASEGQVIAGSPPQVILVEMIHGNILIFFIVFDGQTLNTELLDYVDMD